MRKFKHGDISPGDRVIVTVPLPCGGPKTRMVFKSSCLPRSSFEAEGPFCRCGARAIFNYNHIVDVDSTRVDAGRKTM